MRGDQPISAPSISVIGNTAARPERDRRAQDRASVGPLQVFPSTVDGLRFKDRLYLLDYSEVGMRVNTTLPFPDGECLVRFEAGGEKLELEVRKAWSDKLVGGFWVTGLEFVHPEAAAVETLRKVVPAAYDTPARRRSFRIPQVTEMLVGSPSGDRWLAATSLDFSPEGVRVIVDRYAAKGDQLPLQMSLAKGGQLFAMAEVAWRRHASRRGLELGLRLIDMGPQTAEVFRRHLEGAGTEGETR